MNKGDVVKRKAFRERYEIIADRQNPDTGFVSPYGGTYQLASGYDFVIVNVDEDWPEGEIRPYQQVMENEIEPFEEI